MLLCPPQRLHRRPLLGAGRLRLRRGLDAAQCGQRLPADVRSPVPGRPLRRTEPVRMHCRPPGGQPRRVQVCAALRERLSEWRVHVAEFLPLRVGLCEGSQGRRSAVVLSAVEPERIENDVFDVYWGLFGTKYHLCYNMDLFCCLFFKQL